MVSPFLASLEKFHIHGSSGSFNLLCLPKLLLLLDTQSYPTSPPLQQRWLSLEDVGGILSLENAYSLLFRRGDMR